MNIVTHDHSLKAAGPTTITALLDIAPGTRAGRIRARDLQAFTFPNEKGESVGCNFDGKKLQLTEKVLPGTRLDADNEAREFARRAERKLKLPLHSITFQPTVRQLARRRS